MDRFTPATKEWFSGAFPAPTPAQIGAWDAISSGHHSLVIAPTGSGKTLSAFLWALDSFIRRAEGQAALPGLDQDAGNSGAGNSGPGNSAAGEPDRDSLKSKARAAKKKHDNAGTRVLYISPLKALGVDVERNLRSPLIGITQTARRLGIPAPQVSVGVRSGDTSPAERRSLASHPPDVLITTPESLYLMLTSKARETLTRVDTVIIDEVHAVAGTKRGAHLALTLERLDALLAAPAQRIGLSATVEPRAEVARFLGGSRPVALVAPASSKTWDLTVTVPVPDLSDLPSASGAHDLGPGSSPEPNASIWPHVEEKIVDLVEANSSTIVFANSRRLAERLTGRLNEIHAARQGLDAPPSDTETNAPVPLSEVLPQVLPANGAPAQIMAQAGTTAGAPDLLARAHHGSVSKERRAEIEDDLKSGRLRCVVATSSLELGIDMGLVDLVIQVEAPGSVSSGLQRVGRAGHQVGSASTGVFFPKHRGDLVSSAVTVERMLAGRIEAMRVPTNPLDVLAQQTVAACALGPIDVEEWFDLARGSAPFASLPRSAFDATLDLLAGKYPSDEFAELRPRIVWDRTEGTIEGRPGAQRLAVTSGGTIPDRGLFGVFLASSDDAGTGGKRVGELDEEMVYESRVGDVFALGATSWRIEDITHDRVLVSPAFGQPGKLPFWHGDGLGRPAELGAAQGRFQRELAVSDDAAARERLGSIGLDEWAADNLLAYLHEQLEATTAVPSDTTFVLERFQDELGDWRVILHSPYGMPVHAPWALAVGARLHERYGLDGSAMAADDGIVLRVPLMDDEPPGMDLFLFDPEELQDVVTTEVGGSALFAARFRECAARALLLPRRDPGKRTPLWQQRQRSAQLLDVARKYPQFPIILETVRECLQDVYDLPALHRLATDLQSRKIRVIETQTVTPSPFAQSLLFGYVAQFLYEGDSPLAERRAAALSLDPSLLADLLGREELRELLDAEVMIAVEQEAQRLAPQRRLRGVEGVADLVRMLGPLSAPDLALRLQGDVLDPAAPGAADGQHQDRHDGQEDPAQTGHATLEQATQWAQELVTARRALPVHLNGQAVFAAIEDAARLRDAIGVALPMGVPLAFVEPVPDPLGDLVGRYARTHGPFTATEAAAALGLAGAVVTQTLQRLAQESRVSAGEYRPVPAGEQEWCETEVLRRIRRRSLAALRADVEPVEQPALARFLADWQYLPTQLRGVDGVALVVEQLSGVPIPASAWEGFILPSRVRGYQAAWLDELMTSGEVLFSGAGSLSGTDGWVALHLADSAPLTLHRDEEFVPGALHERILEALSGGGGWFMGQLSARLETMGPRVPDLELNAALWDLVWAGLITNDSYGAVRGMLSGGKAAHKRKPEPRARTSRLGHVRGLRTRGGYGAGLPAIGMRRDGVWEDRATGHGNGADGGEEPSSGDAAGVGRGFRPDDAAVPARAGDPTASGRDIDRRTGRATPLALPSAQGRWSLLPAPEADPTLRAHATSEVLLDRYGVLTKGSVEAEEVPGGFGMLYKVLTRMEDQGITRRGYFVEKLGAAQFSTSATVDRLRSHTHDDVGVRREGPLALALAATDPANPYGAALAWPALPIPEGAPTAATGHRPGRKAGAVVVLVDGALVLYVERGGKTVLCFDDSEAVLAVAAPGLVGALRTARVEKLSMQKVNGAAILDTPLARALVAAGFGTLPSGLRFRA
ncbi:Lhr family ATP-dependent helicase [Galactobacter caseinivorans]|uniref:ATP-dependent helicase n=1 Tax=Galactobacter caseinivorans TaxID=2676123 RepID=A0A496PHU2_9MICC|nr:DEAD/DEAH box helicase [Galactobacter caseinivorans]RKW70020.1 ATP-dependent helicase [Galactobacter caseinivorans]